MDFTGKRIHMIGIGGSSMSGLAEICKSFGAIVQGSELNLNSKTEHLEMNGIKVKAGHSPDNILFPDNALPDLVVYTAAVRPDNPELTESLKLNLKVLERKDLLGLIMAQYDFSIAVCGTHGKTTTTSMISSILLNAGRDPGIHIGGELKELGGGTRAGNGSIFVTEACEYVDSFLSLKPSCAVVLNIDKDHLDYFRDINHITESFSKFLSQVDPEGFVVVNSDDPHAMSAASSARCRVVYYSSDRKPTGYCPSGIVFDMDGFPSYNLVKDYRFICRISLRVTGMHNISNSVAAAALCVEAGISPSQVSSGLSNFSGTAKRFEYKGNRNGVAVYDDYAHHPAEIRATLNTAKLKLNGSKEGRIICVFQPHTYTRAKIFEKDFSVAFSEADRVIVTEIYASRENDPGDVYSGQLVDTMKKDGLDAVLISRFEDIAEMLASETKSGDLVITMGAGDVVKVCDLFLSIPVIP